MTTDITPFRQLPEHVPQLDIAFDILLYSLSETSQRQYRHTFRQWATFCDERGLPYIALTAPNLIAFLERDDLAHRTKQARLSHLRKLLETLHAQSPGDVQIEAMVKQAQLLKLKRPEREKSGESRPKYALSAEQVHRAFGVFDQESKLHARNRALLAILFYTGLRRAEAVALRWDDLDLDNRMITVRHGKGDKERTIPLLGGVDYLSQWRALTPGRTWVFCGFRKGNTLREDAPMNTNTVWTVMKAVQNVLGLAGLSPHDARRTVITAILNNGGSVADAQFLAGHANPQTTLHYAQVQRCQRSRRTDTGQARVLIRKLCYTHSS